MIDSAVDNSSSPLAIERVVRTIPEGRVLPLDHLRAGLALQFAADYTCPMTTGIFLRILAEAAVEEHNDVPYWRVVRPDGRWIDKLPGGEAAQARLLKAEGVPCRKAGATGFRVLALQEVLWRPA
ncbi:MAG TPA: hypothetical protein DEH78_25975 [Solibacterales bacterium]|nr:hypothetical protein [Bryobacterales bacterium]